MNIQNLLSPLFSNGAGLFALVILGFFTFIGFFSKRKDDKEEKSEKEGDRLIGILQGTVDQLEKKLTIQTDLLNKTMSRTQALETENNVYKEVFQGRDEQMQKFMKDGFEAMGIIPEMIMLMKSTNQNVEKLYEILVSQNKALVQVAEKA